MAIDFPNFDSLPVGTGYASVSTPTSDAADTPALPSHVPDSINTSETFQVVSLETVSQDGPMNPAPYWNSGEKETLTILE